MPLLATVPADPQNPLLAGSTYSSVQFSPGVCRFGTRAVPNRVGTCRVHAAALCSSPRAPARERVPTRDFCLLYHECIVSIATRYMPVNGGSSVTGVRARKREMTSEMADGSTASQGARREIAELNVLHGACEKAQPSSTRLLLRAEDAAALCSISVRTWRTRDAAGHIPSPIHIGRSAFWRLEELRAWIDAGCPRRDVWLARK